MPLTFPLALDQFADQLRKTQVGFDLDDGFDISGETGNAEVLTASRGYPLWGGALRVATAKVDDFEPYRAKIGLLRRPGASFLIGDVFKRAPLADPTGTGLAGHAPKVSTVASDRRTITITSLPPGYVISDGDHLSISFDGGRLAYFRVVTGDTASPGLATHLAAVEVDPCVPFPIATGDPVTLVNPALKAKIVPGSLRGGERRPGGLSAPLSFAWRQTMDR